MSDPISSLSTQLRAGRTVITGWSTLAEPILAETLARAGYGAVTLDMQHGFYSTDSVLRGIAAVTLAGKPTIVRVPVGAFATASRVLDMGAAAVIAPMINSLEDAREFAGAMKFPPMGERSWGPAHAMALSGIAESATYLAKANHKTMAFAMIETREAVAALDAIVGVAGIDGVFVGPSDLSIALTDGASVDPMGARVMAVAREIAQHANAAGKVPGIFCSDLDHVAEALALGFRLIAIGVDSKLVGDGAQALLSKL